MSPVILIEMKKAQKTQSKFQLPFQPRHQSLSNTESPGHEVIRHILLQWCAEHRLTTLSPAHNSSCSRWWLLLLLVELYKATHIRARFLFCFVLHLQRSRNFHLHLSKQHCFLPHPSSPIIDFPRERKKKILGKIKKIHNSVFLGQSATATAPLPAHHMPTTSHLSGATR